MKTEKFFKRASEYVLDIKKKLDEGRDAEVPALSAVVRDAIKNGEKKLFTADEFHRKALTGTTGIVDLILQTDVRTQGVTSFDKGKLDQGKVMCVTGIGFRYATAATALAADAVRYSSAEYLATFHTGVVNSELSIKAGNELLYKGRTSKFLTNAFAEWGAAGNDENIVELEQPKMFDYTQLLEMQLKFGPNSVAAAGTNTYYSEITFYGAILADRN